MIVSFEKCEFTGKKIHAFEISMELSETDRKILRVVQKDARLTKNEIAEATNTSTSSCWRRLQALEQNGTIQRYEARLDAEALGLSFSALAMVSLTRHDNKAVEEITRAIGIRKEVLQVFSITGDADFLLRVVVKDMVEYNAFLNDFLFRQACVVKVNTNVVMATIKDTAELPI